MDFADILAIFYFEKKLAHRVKEHEKNNRDVRQVLEKSNIYPEKLPPKEDIEKLERRIKNQDKKAFQNTEELPQNIVLPPV